jgi:hypothetical protein
MNRNQTTGKLFEKYLLDEFKKYGYSFISSKHTEHEYTCDAIADKEDVMIEIKSHRTYPDDSVKDTFKRLMDRSIESTEESYASGLFHQWCKGCIYGGSYFVIVGLYTEPALSHAKAMMDHRGLSNYHNYDLLWHYKGQTHFCRMTKEKFFECVKKKKPRSFKSLLEVLMTFTNQASGNFHIHEVDGVFCGQDEGQADFQLTDKVSWEKFVDWLNKYNEQEPSSLPKVDQVTWTVQAPTMDKALEDIYKAKIDKLEKELDTWAELVDDLHKRLDRHHKLIDHFLG